MHLQLLTELLDAELILIHLEQKEDMVLIALVAVSAHELNDLILKHKHSVVPSTHPARYIQLP